MTDVIIRRMTLDDVPQVHQIEAATFTVPWTYASFVYEMTGNPVARYLVAETESEIIGFAGAHIIMDEGHIINIAVKENSRGLGIGGILLESLKQYASNLGVIYMTLEVRVSNAAAIAMYEKQGFIKVHIRKKYYEDTGEDAWLMVCDSMPAADPDFEEPETLHA